MCVSWKNGLSVQQHKKHSILLRLKLIFVTVTKVTSTLKKVCNSQFCWKNFCTTVVVGRAPFSVVLLAPLPRVDIAPSNNIKDQNEQQKATKPKLSLYAAQSIHSLSETIFCLVVPLFNLLVLVQSLFISTTHLSQTQTNLPLILD